MENICFTKPNNHLSLAQKKLFKQTNKSLCKLKTNKFRAQPVKLAMSTLNFWKKIKTPNLKEIQYLNFVKYNCIQIKISNSQADEKISIVLKLNTLKTLDVMYQPWFTTLGTVLILVNLENGQLNLINTTKVQSINIFRSKEYVTFKTSLVSYKTKYTTFKYLNKSYKIKNCKLTKQMNDSKLSKLMRLKSVLKSKIKKSNHNLIKITHFFKKPVKKFSKKWYYFEYKKSKRFKTKYDGRDLKNAPLLSLRFLKRSNFKKRLFFRFQDKIKFIKDFIIEEIARKKRLKVLLGDKSTKVKRKKKNRLKYFKYSRFAIKKKTKTFKILNMHIKKQGSASSNSLLAVVNKNTKRYIKKKKVIKIKLIQRLFLKKSKNTPKKTSKRSASSKNLKGIIKRINKQINYRIKWFNYYEFKSFRWKFHRKRWYFTMSRWKRLAEFRRMLRNAWRSHRKLQKNFLFIKLLRANFKHILGITEGELLEKWTKIRRGTNLNNSISSVEYLNQSLQLKLDGLSLFLGFAPNRLMAQEFIHFGGLRVNGSVSTDKNFSLHQGDMLQLDTKIIQEIRALYKDTHWNSVRARLKFTPFLQTQWSIMLFMLIRWPQNYELFEESILNQRWVRFFIRYFPVRISKYKKAKIKWYKY